jgi:hypothetical protein
MPHGTYVRPKPCHIAFMLCLNHATWRLCYDMAHGTYVRPCHMAFKQSIKHATYAKPRLCHVTRRLGLSHPTWHLGTT